MKYLFVFTLSIISLQSLSQEDKFDTFRKIDSTYKATCLDIFEDQKLVILYDSLLKTSRECRIAALDTFSNMTDVIKKSYKSNIEAEAEGARFQLYALANSNGISLDEQKLLLAQEKCISFFEEQEAAYTFTIDTNIKLDFNIYEDKSHIKFIQPHEPIWVDVYFGNNQSNSIDFRAEWNEENEESVLIKVPEGGQICKISYSDKGSRGNYKIELDKSFVYDDPNKQSRVTMISLDIDITGSFEFYDRWSSKANLTDVKIQIIPYYYDLVQRVKYGCNTPTPEKLVKGTRSAHDAWMKYDPKSAEENDVILKN